MEFDEIKSILQVLGAVGGAVWFLYTYFKEGLHRPKIEFDIICKVVGQSEVARIVEFQISANNKGRIKFTFPELRLRIRSISDLSKLEYFQNTYRLQFPVKIFEDNIIPDKYKYYFVEPGTKQTLTYITKVDIKNKIIAVFASFKYKQRFMIRLKPFRIVREQHTCERSFNLSSIS